MRPDLYFLETYNNITTYYKEAGKDPLKDVVGGADHYFFIPKNNRKSLRPLDWLKNNTTVKIIMVEHIQWFAQDSGVPPLYLVSLTKYLIKRPDGFYLHGKIQEPPADFKEKTLTNGDTDATGDTGDTDTN